MNFINQLLENLKKERCILHLSDMQLLSKFNNRFRFLFCVIDIFSKYAWIIPLKDKKGISIVNSFQKILNDLKRSKAEDKGRKPNKI